MSAVIGRKVVRVSKTDFELDNGAVYPHLVPLDVVPSVEEFQKTYDSFYELFKAQGLLLDEPIKPKRTRKHRKGR